jgi:hypothetical protein
MAIDKQDLKKEYLRGLSEHNQIMKDSYGTFLELLKSRLKKVTANAVIREDYEEGIDEVIELIDEYLNETPVNEILARAENQFEDEIEELEEDLEEITNDDIISLTDFINDRD